MDRRMLAVVLLLLMAPTVAGCIRDTPAAPKEPGGAVPSPVSVIQRIEKYGCTLHVGIHVFPLDAARRAEYPSDFRPRLFGLANDLKRVDDAETMAQVTVLAAECQNGTANGRHFGPSIVLGLATGVHAPPKYQRPEAGFEHAIVEIWSTNDTEANALTSWGFGGRSNFTVQRTGQAGGFFSASAQGRAGNATVSLRTTIPGGADPRPLDNADAFERYFAAHDRKVTGYVDNNLSAPELVGRLTAQLEVAGGTKLFGASGSGDGLLMKYCDICSKPSMVWTFHPISS